MHDREDRVHQPCDQPAERANRRPLIVALAITTLVLVAEVVGGLLTNSLALLADAGHMATDAVRFLALSVASWVH